jgi:hypothetical protein
MGTPAAVHELGQIFSIRDDNAVAFGDPALHIAGGTRTADRRFRLRFCQRKPRNRRRVHRSVTRAPRV